MKNGNSEFQKKLTARIEDSKKSLTNDEYNRALQLSSSYAQKNKRRGMDKFILALLLQEAVILKSLNEYRVNALQIDPTVPDRHPSTNLADRDGIDGTDDTRNRAAASLRKMYHQIKDALIQVEWHEYGVCFLCSEKIPEDKLAVEPWRASCSPPCEEKLNTSIPSNSPEILQLSA